MMDLLNQKRDIQNAADIKQLVDTFYWKVKEDKLLFPIFNDVAKVDWDHHLPVMYQFWETLLFKSGGYSGKPFPKHFVLPVTVEHFERWLFLFRQNVDEHYEGAKAIEAKNWAASIADTFQRRMGLI
jgi:hemoglobin